MNHRVFRKDRDSNTSAKESGGGVLIAVDNSIPSVVLPSYKSNLEALFVRLDLPHNTKLLLGCVYIPPNMPTVIYRDLCAAFEEAASFVESDQRIILAGDFNLPNTDWCNVNVESTNASAQTILQLANYFNLTQHNTIRNYRGVLLDLLFSTMDLFVNQEFLPLVFADAHHPPLMADVPLMKPKPLTSYVPSPVFRRCNLDGVKEDLSRTSLLPAFTSDVNVMFGFFTHQLKTVVLRHTPMKKSHSSVFPCWFTKELKDLVIRKKILHKDYKRTHKLVVYFEFSRVRRLCRDLSKQCYLDYVQHVEDVIPNNPKVFWSYARNLSRQEPLPSKLILDDVTSSNPDQISDMFANFFSSVYSPTSCMAVNYEFPSYSSISSFSFSCGEVRKELLSLDIAKGCGHDLIPPNVLRHCCDLVAGPILTLFNLSLKTGVYPLVLKQGYVIPIHKSGSKEDVKNYRPITIQPVLAKLFEKLVLKRIAPFFKSIIVPNQHGFTPHKSTETNLLTFQNHVASAFDDGSQLDVIYLDFSKAFDKVSHTHLIAKLRALGVTGSLLSWFSSYLDDRHLQVRFSNCLSSKFLATSGVPQGSHLGPILFLVFVNDILEHSPIEYLLFADDIKIFRKIETLADCVLLQECLDWVLRWCEINAMSLNIKKCICVTFHRKKTPILFSYSLEDNILERHSTVRDLGVILSHDLSPEQHVLDVCKRAQRNLGFLFRTTRGMKRITALKMLYSSLVRSTLDYCSSVWSPHQVTFQAELQNIQDRFLRVVGVRLGYAYLDAPISEIGQALSLHPLTTRRCVHDVLLLFKLLNNLVDAPELLALVSFRCPTAQTRSRELFVRKHVNTNYQANFFSNRVLHLGNLVCQQLDFFGCSYSFFRNNIYTVLKDV